LRKVQFTLLEQKARGGESWQTKGRKAMSECDELREAVRQKEAEIAKRDEAVKSSLGLVHALREDLATCRASLAEKEQRIIELERRLRIPFGKLPCAQCGGPHDFDTSLPSVVWNKVIRAKGLPEYLCTTCIVREFVRAGEGFTATLWGEGFHGVPIEVSINNQNAKDAALIQEENNDYRVRLAEKEQELAIWKGKYNFATDANVYANRRLAEAQQEIERLRQGLWDCALWSGMDGNGNKTPHHSTGALVKIAVDAVREHREGYDELLDELQPIAAARQEGWEQGRDAAADICRARATAYQGHDLLTAHECEQCVAAIRSLTYSENPK
jgi:hypothetical protein